jgi:hypothetical protein
MLLLTTWLGRSGGLAMKGRMEQNIELVKALHFDGCRTFKWCPDRQNSGHLRVISYVQGYRRAAGPTTPTAADCGTGGVLLNLRLESKKLGSQDAWGVIILWDGIIYILGY